MSAPRVTTAPSRGRLRILTGRTAPASARATRSLSLNGRSPRDVIEYRLLVDEPDLDLVVRRRGVDEPLPSGWPRRRVEPLGAEVSSAVFDRVRTCDNHCEFCFIHQLPKGMRRSLYLKDDDYRLSFLYGNFTTLTRFTEMDLERVLTERLSPLFVSIHATDPDIRADLLRNRRGATSLRWLRALLDGGIEVHGQVVVCPGRNDGAVLDDTLAGVLDRYPTLATVACVPLGVSRFSHESRHAAPHRRGGGRRVRRWWSGGRTSSSTAIGRRMVFAADEYYLMAERPFPPAAHLRGLPPARERAGHGPGLRGRVRRRRAGRPRRPARVLRRRRRGPGRGLPGPRRRTRPTRRRCTAAGDAGRHPHRRVRRTGPRPRWWARWHATTSGWCRWCNHFFGGNIGVSGLLTGADLVDVLARQPEGHRYLLPDSCLSEGRFLDDLTAADLPRPVEVVPTDGLSLRRAPRRRGADRRARPSAGAGDPRSPP